MLTRAGPGIMGQMEVPAVLRASELFEGLPDSALRHFLDATVERTAAANEEIFSLGESGEALYLVVSGKVRIFRDSLNGRRKSLAFINPGGVFGEMSLVEERPRSASAEAVEDTTLRMMFRDYYCHYIERYPRFAHNIARIIASRLREANDEVLLLTFEEARTKIAYSLLKMARHNLGRSVSSGWQLPLVHQEVANLAGTSRETATRVLHEFRDRGILSLSPGGIVILDVSRLEEQLFGA